MIQRLKGTYDVLPGEIEKWQYVEGKAKEVFENFGYKEIRTPVIEATELFQRGVGDTTDVVEKEMYVFDDKGGQKLKDKLNEKNIEKMVLEAKFSKIFHMER